MGGHFLFDDDQETPNTLTALFEFDEGGEKEDDRVRGAALDLQSRGRHRRAEARQHGGHVFYGSNGYLSMWDEDHSKYQSYLGREQAPGPVGREAIGNHWANFITAVRSRKQSDLNAPIEEGAISTTLVHLANISYRLGRTLHFDAATYSCTGDREANRMFKREYRKPFEVPEKV